jgi:hypothetical protein
MKGFYIVLEVEEVYGDVWDIGAIQRNWEGKLLAAADSYITVSDLLAERLTARARMVLYGSYRLPECQAKLPTNDSVCLVYAGTIDSTRGAAVKAIQCVRYLPANYQVHLCGAGNVDEIVQMKEMIHDVNAESGRMACVFHGFLHGEAFSALLSSCHIALNPQRTGDYMCTAFPSKIVKYLSYNLRVVSSPIESVIKSPLASLVTFSNDDSPKAIAQAIQSLDLTETFDSRTALRRLDEQFRNGIVELLA